MERPNDITYFAETDFRNQQKKFGIKQVDRTRHVYAIGKTGMGKSTLLQNMAIQDVQSDRGIAFLDPHGNLVEELLDFVPEERLDDVLYFAPFDLEHPISFNVMEDVGDERRHLVANGLMSAFKKIWVDMWSARMEYILNNTLLALLEYPDSTLLGVNRMLSDKTYRKRVVANISDVAVRSFWEDEFASYSDRYMVEAVAAIQNKIGQFISNPLVRNIIGQSRSSFDFRELIDNKKIVLINLSKGKVGEDNANLLGSMIITKIYLSAMSRSDVAPHELSKLPQFNFFVDEFQSFANESFKDILSEARKYKLNLTIAHQYIEQMTDEVRAAVFGNVGTMITFRVGATDAEYLEKEFAPVFEAEDIVNLGFAQIYLRLMIDGVGSRPFSARTLKPLPKPKNTYADEVIRRSRKHYALDKSEVEEQLAVWHESHGGLINDPNVKRKREKEHKERDEQIESYKESRKNLDNIENKPSAPRPGNPSKPVKRDKGSDNSKSNNRPDNKNSSANSKKSKKSSKKKTSNKKSFADLRDTLAGVLDEAGLDVPENITDKKRSKQQNSSTSKNSAKQKSADSAGANASSKKDDTKQGESGKVQKSESDSGNNKGKEKKNSSTKKSDKSNDYKSTKDDAKVDNKKHTSKQVDKTNHQKESKNGNASDKSVNQASGKTDDTSNDSGETQKTNKPKSSSKENEGKSQKEAKEQYQSFQEGQKKSVHKNKEREYRNKYEIPESDLRKILEL